MLRIAVSKQDKETVVVIEGELVASELGELKRVRGSVSGPVILDLEDLISADAISIVELCDWIQGGAQTRGASPYTEMLLEQKLGIDESQVSDHP